MAPESLPTARELLERLQEIDRDPGRSHWLDMPLVLSVRHDGYVCDGEAEGNWNTNIIRGYERLILEGD